MTPAKSAPADRNAIHTLAKLTDLPVAGLVDGVTYYVQWDAIAAADQANRFQLSDRNGAIIDLDTAET